MKKILLILFSILMLGLLAGCGSSDAAPKQTSSDNGAEAAAAETKSNGKKILIAYFSHSGNTSQAAEQIHALTGGDIAELKTETPYPTSYNECTEIAKQERETNARPKLATKIGNINNYDVIFIGYPIWWYTAPMAVHTFLESHDLSGKTVIPFCTSGGSDISESLPAIQNLCPNSAILPGLTANNPNDIKPWLSKIGVL